MNMTLQPVMAGRIEIGARFVEEEHRGIMQMMQQAVADHGLIATERQSRPRQDAPDEADSFAARLVGAGGLGERAAGGDDIVHEPDVRRDRAAWGECVAHVAAPGAAVEAGLASITSRLRYRRTSAASPLGVS